MSPRPHAKFYPSPAQRAVIEYLAANVWRHEMAIFWSTRQVLLQQKIIYHGEGEYDWRVYLTTKGQRIAASLGFKVRT